MFNEIILASVNSFNQGVPDKNGRQPVILNIIAGKSPNRLVLSGTVADSIGLSIGKSYVMQVREVEPDPTYGRQFNHQVLAEVTSALDLIKTAKEIGVAQVINVGETAESGETGATGATAESMTLGTQSETATKPATAAKPAATPVEND